jgi:23S rRNA pseudouridine1911/1915/1917 synthase
MIMDKKSLETIDIKVDIRHEGERIDRYLAEELDNVSRSRIHRLLEEGNISVNEQNGADKNYRLHCGDLIRVVMPAPEKMEARAESIPISVVYEDENILIVNKARGMVVHPAPGHSGGTLVNALLSHCKDLSGIGGVIRPGIVHRLDKDTSGLLIAAKNDRAHSALSAQLKKRTLHREYIALVHGRVEPAAGKIIAPVGRHPVKRKKMAVTEKGREAISRYRLIRYYGNFSLLKVKLETGRTHQIRVHMAYLGHPIVGDSLYGPGSSSELPPELVSPQALHARKIIFKHPVTGTRMEFSAHLPPEFTRMLQFLFKNQG